MKVLIGCDVDPILPPLLSRPVGQGIWDCLSNIEELLNIMQYELPPITWLIRSDYSIKFSTGNFASGYMARQSLWDLLLEREHELGWHMHLISFDKQRGYFRFDPDPLWLAESYETLNQYFDIRATRTGWDFGSNTIFQRLNDLGVSIDFSALPGNIVWIYTGYENIAIDWLRAPNYPYHPSFEDFQHIGNLRLLEVPITQFPNSFLGTYMRLIRRITNRCISMRGLQNKTRTIASAWNSLPSSRSTLWTFFFHPEELDKNGIKHFIRNVNWLRNELSAEFVTASQVYELFAGGLLGG